MRARTTWAAGLCAALCIAVSELSATAGSGLTTSLLVVLGFVAAVTGPWSAAGPGKSDVELDTGDLCTAWQRSYFQLLVTRDATARRCLVQRRQDYLDEIERRDPDGFRRWLDSGARPGGDPEPYLTAGR
jgi:hypothetical protein